MVEPTHLKNISQNGCIPNFRGENQKYLKFDQPDDMGYAPNGSGIWHTLQESLKLGKTAQSQNARGTEQLILVGYIFNKTLTELNR